MQKFCFLLPDEMVRCPSKALEVAVCLWLSGPEGPNRSATGCAVFGEESLEPPWITLLLSSPLWKRQPPSWFNAQSVNFNNRHHLSAHLSSYIFCSCWKTMLVLLQQAHHRFKKPDTHTKNWQTKRAICLLDLGYINLLFNPERGIIALLFTKLLFIWKFLFTAEICI